MSSFRGQACKSCRERQEELLESGDGSQLVCLCYDELTDEEMEQLKLEEVFADEVTALVLSEIEEAFLPAGSQLEIDEGLLNSTQLKIDENATNSSQLEEVFAGSSRCKTDEVSSIDNISLPRTTPKNAANDNKNAHPPAPMKRKVNESSKLASNNVEPELKKRLFHEAFPTDEEFTKCARSMNYPNEIMKWRNVLPNKIYRVLSIEIKGSSENPYVATMESENGNIFKVWIRARIYDQLKIYDMNKKCVYIKSHGLKPCKKDPLKQYFDFSIIAKDQ